MLNLQEFLETTTIHGLPRIVSSKKKILKLFWFLVVLIGFSAAGSLIYNALQDYENDPITTKIETFPISKLTFPAITVCPPKGSYTNLNYDLLNLDKNVKWLNETDKLELQQLTQEIILSNEIDTFVQEESRFKIKNKYESWYLGLSEMKLSYIYTYNVNYRKFEVETSYVEGEIETPDYGVDYSKENYLPYIMYKIKVNLPAKAENETIMLEDVLFVLEGEIDTKKTKGDGYDYIRIGYIDWSDSFQLAGKQSINRTYPVSTLRRGKIEIKYTRQFPDQDMMEWKFKRNTGFRLRWFYADKYGNKIDMIPDSGIKKQDKNFYLYYRNLQFIKFVNIFSQLSNNQKHMMLKIIRYLRQEYDRDINVCKEDMLEGAEVENMFQIIQQHFNVTTANEILYKVDDFISNATIVEAGPIFTWMVRCPDLYWIAWREFLKNLFDNYSLKKILMVLFNMRNVAKYKNKAIF